MQDHDQDTAINHSDETNGAAVNTETTPINDETVAAENSVMDAMEAVAAAAKEEAHEAETEKLPRERFDFRRRALLKELEQKEKDFDKLRDDYARLALQHADLKDRHLRLAAEMENFRKRLEREFSNRVESRIADLMAELLPVVDDLERFFGVGSEAKDYDSLAAGARLIYQNVLKILQNRGLTTMATVGQPFDPNRHEALLQMPVEGKESNLVVQETTKGYLLFDKVLRPAKVIVSV